MNIVISSRSFNPYSRYLARLQKHNIRFGAKNRKLPEEELLKMVDDKTIGIIAGTEQISKAVIDSAPNLRVISRYGAGLDNIDIDYCKEKNIKICITTKQTLAVAEFTLTLMLSLLKKVHKTSKELGNLLTRSTVGIVGYGVIGQEVARLLKPFKCLKHIHDIRYGYSIGLQEIFEYSDIVTIHLPLTPATRHIINKPLFTMANSTLLLVNTSRGGIVDETALYNALKTNQIAGAAVDVFEQEPYSGPLTKLDNIILTPHIASYTYETREEMEAEAVNNLLSELCHGRKKKE